MTSRALATLTMVGCVHVCYSQECQQGAGPWSMGVARVSRDTDTLTMLCGPLEGVLFFFFFLCRSVYKVPTSVACAKAGVPCVVTLGFSESPVVLAILRNYITLLSPPQ